MLGGQRAKTPESKRASCWACAAAGEEELEVRLGPRVRVAKSLILCKEYTATAEKREERRNSAGCPRGLLLLESKSKVGLGGALSGCVSMIVIIRRRWKLIK